MIKPTLNANSKGTSDICVIALRANKETFGYASSGCSSIVCEAGLEIEDPLCDKP